MSGCESRWAVHQRAHSQSFGVGEEHTHQNDTVLGQAVITLPNLAESAFFHIARQFGLLADIDHIPHTDRHSFCHILLSIKTISLKKVTRMLNIIWEIST